MITINEYKENDNFSLDELFKIDSFAGRKRYCDKYLKYITSGTARLVYKLNDKQVLKLAKNNKGILQNTVEYNYYNDVNIDNDIFAKVYDNSDNAKFYFLVSEYATKCKKSDFKRLIGFTFNDYINALKKYETTYYNSKFYSNDIDNDIYDKMWEDEFMSSIFDFIGNFAIPIGDLIRLNSYGIVKHNNKDTIVIVDSGLNNDVLLLYK